MSGEITATVRPKKRVSVVLLQGRAYPVSLYTGAVAGILAGSQWAAAHGMSATKVRAAMLLLLVPALAGARLLFVAFHWDIYRREPVRILRPAEGGAALYGGLVLSVLASMALLPVVEIDVWTFWDAGAIAMLIGMVCTKIGCYLHGCCPGRADARVFHRLPLQLCEAGMAGLILFASLRVTSHDPRGGSVFFTALALYGAVRWLLEPIRETPGRIGGVAFNRVISAVLVTVGVAHRFL